MFVKIHIGHTQSWFSVELRASRELANQVQLKSEIISAILFATPEYHIKSSHCHNDYRHRQHHRSDRSLQARPAITWSASVFPDNLPSTTHHVVATHQGSTNNTRTLTSSLAGRPTMILPSKTAVYQTLAKQCRETVESSSSLALFLCCWWALRRQASALEVAFKWRPPCDNCSTDQPNAQSAHLPNPKMWTHANIWGGS